MLAFAWWLCTGEYMPAVPLAIFFELFWLDLIPIGSSIPPMPSFPYLILLALAGTFGWTGPSQLAFPLILSLPLAYLVPYFEARQRNLQKAAYNRLLTQARKVQPLGSLPGRLLAVSALQQICMGIVLFYAVGISLCLLFSQPQLREHLLWPMNVGWLFLFAIAAIGGVMALRIKLAYLAFIICMAGGLIVRIF